MKIEILPQEFAVCKVRGLPQELLEKEFVFFSHTDRELSLVCPKSVMPLDCKTAETGWRGMRIQGQLEFSLIGILAKISTLLAENGISLFAVSTYDTDYFFVKEERFEKAVQLLNQGGYALTFMS